MTTHKRNDEILIIPCRSTRKTEQESANAKLMTLSFGAEAQSSAAESGAPTEGGDGYISYSWADGIMNSILPADTTHTVSCSERMYLTLELPVLPRNPRIKRAELVLPQHGCELSGNCEKLAVYAVTGEVFDGECTPAHDTIPLDICIAREEDEYRYSLDVTELLDRYYRGEIASPCVMLALIDSTCDSDCVKIIAADQPEGPEIHITYESCYGENGAYRAHTHGIGSICQGNVDLSFGNLTLGIEDIAWAGARMPVNLRHVYSGALSGVQYTGNEEIKLPAADFSAMNIGAGFRLNVMQSMRCVQNLPYDVYDTAEEDKSGYVYIDGEGRETYFMRDGEKYKDVEETGMSYDPATRILTVGSETCTFDQSGRLVSVSDEHANTRTVTYTDGRIAEMTDGAGRAFVFGYTDGSLTSVTAPDGSVIGYGYTDGNLTAVTYPDTKMLTLEYSSDKLSAVTLYENGTAKYKVAYTYNPHGGVYRVTEYGTENGAFLSGATTVYSYSAAARRTITQTTERADAECGESEPNVIKTIYTFDCDGNVASEYSYSEDTGNVSAESGAGINPIPDNMGYSAPVVNLLRDHSFDSLDAWENMPGNDTGMSISVFSGNKNIRHGRSALRMTASNTEARANGLYQGITCPAGEYTFSAYVRGVSLSAGDNAGVYLRVSDGSEVLCESERVSKVEGEYIRISAGFTLSEEKTVNAEILADGKCGAYIDSAQLERGGYAGEYNLLENGSFTDGIGGWTGDGVHKTTVYFNEGGSALIAGDINSEKKMYRQIPVNAYADVRESFRFSGWARSNGIPVGEREGIGETSFRLYAEMHYRDGSADEPVYADFSSAPTEWQYASLEIAKKERKPADYILVGCEYSRNFGSAYFDGLTLTRTGIETGLTADDFAEYDEDEESEATTDDAELVSDAETEETASEFEELTDSFGNSLTETTASDGEFGTLYRAFAYGNNGNDLVRETDARGGETAYTVDVATSRNTAVTDRMENVTEYEYDAAGRTTKVTSKDAQGSEQAHVEYAYDAFDNMTEIVRGDGMKYVLRYNAYHNLESIGVDGKTDGGLVTYAYKTGNGRLKGVTYANGDTMRATYNSIGQMIAEKWFDASNTLTAYYKYVYDAQGNIVRSIDLTAEKEYTYYYENSMLARSAEYDITVENELVTAKTHVASTRYYYDAEGTLTRKRVIHADGSENVIYHESNDGNTTVGFTAGGRNVTSRSGTDGFGRKTFDELQLGTGFVSRQFAYFAGDIPEEHKTGEKVKSAATTNLVSQLILSDGRTISYEYDAEERITKVTDSIDGTYEYTYDSLGQLLTETVTKDGVTTVVNSMTYDNYGNILAKNGKTYTYGNTAWRDLLTSYDGQTVTYDAQGNPTSYLGHTLTWEKGRQLKSFDNNTYTYNANGIRTSKTINGIRHDYTLDGAKILREAWGNNTLIPLYDNEDSVCGITYNGTPYFFLKNLQGDVIAITDANAEVVARYTYDAWGVCTTLNPDGTANDSVSFVGNVNPYRYRSYYFDAEIGCYYLQSRYYNPVVGRFVNGDDVALLWVSGTVLGYNLFACCKNDIINLYDPTGRYDEALVLSGSLIASMSGALSGIMTGISASIASIKVAIATSWFIPVCIAAAAVAIVGIVYVVNRVNSLIRSATQIITAVKAKIKANGIDPNKLKNYTVYVIVRKNTIDVVYVGITKNYPARKNQHTGKGKRFPTSSFTMMPVATGLSKSQARAMEQTIITAYTLDTLKNMINSISPKKWGNFKTEFDQMTTLIQSWTDPE